MKTLLNILVAMIFSVSLAISGTCAAAVDTTQTVTRGGVTAKVSFLNPKSGEDLRFAVVLDTHSVNLDTYDLKVVSVLRDDMGKGYLPKDAENKTGGHRREVILIFPKVSPQAKRLELVIKDLAGVKERTFRWTLID